MSDVMRSGVEKGWNYRVYGLGSKELIAWREILD